MTNGAKWKKRGMVALGAVWLLGLALVVTVYVRQHREFEAPYPDLHATQDPAVIERGRYFVQGPAHCVDCHAAPGHAGASAPGPLSGGTGWHLPVGDFYAKNITPDRETGIGRYSDGEVARLLRYGVRPDGTAMLPFMRFANMSDEDLVAVLSFLRAQEPVRHEVPNAEPNLLGRVMLAFALEPAGPSGAPRKSFPPAATAEYGRYLASDVAGCINCHTKIDLKTGAYAAPIFSGGAELGSHTQPEKVFVSPNLTPHREDGWLEGWSEDAFVARMRGGRVHEGSPMPWDAYRKLGDDDSRAIFRFLRTLPAAPGGPSPKSREVLLQAER